MTYDTIVFFGRFEPLHNEHLKTLRSLLGMAERVVVLIGSSGAPRFPQHPWTFEEREAMIRSSLGADAKRIVCRPVADHLYIEKAWLSEIERAVADVATGRIAAFGDLRLSWPQIELLSETIDEQALRRHYFDGDADFVRQNVPAAVAEWLETFRHSDAFPALYLEHEMIQKYKGSWANAPFTPIFTTVDTVAICADHVLLIQRRGVPGKGLWAFPGGFIEADEYLIDSARRELKEETCLDFSLHEFRGHVTATHIFDYPQRSQRGRTISQGFRLDLGDGPLPAIEGVDDALQAKWIAITEARTMRDRMFEDHFSILEYFIGLS